MESEPVQANHTKDISKRVKAGFLLFGLGFLIAAVTQLILFMLNQKAGHPFWNICFFSGSVLSCCLFMIACFRAIKSRWRFVFLLPLLLPVWHLILTFIQHSLNSPVLEFYQHLFFWVILFILWIFKALASPLKRSQIAFELWIFLLLGDLACVSKSSYHFEHLGRLFGDEGLWILSRYCLAFAALIIAAIAAFKMRKSKAEAEA